MDWMKQTEELFKMWTENQQKMMDNWSESMKGFGQSSSPAEMWDKTLETWQGVVQNSLNAQSEWTKKWAEAAKSADNVPDEVSAWVKQSEEMAARWNETQRELWENWFTMVKNMQGMVAEHEKNNVMEVWKEYTQKMMKAQSDFANMWMSMGKKE